MLPKKGKVKKENFKNIYITKKVIWMDAVIN